MRGPRSSWWMASASVGVVLALSLSAAGCTKVQEQPRAAQQAAPPPPPVKPPPAKRHVASWEVPSKEPQAAAGQDAAPAPVAAAPAAATLNGDPNGPKREQISKALDGAVGSLANCFNGGPGGSIGLSFDADPSGKATNLKVSGAPAGAERCVRDTMSAVRLPPFEGRAVPIDFPLTVRSTPGVAPAPTPAAAPAPGGTVFVQP